MAMSRPIAVVALMLAVASSFGCAGRTGADGRGALWRKASPTSAAPELQRVNTLLADLAERLRPGLVHVRVRRAAGSEAAGEEPGEPRRSTGSGFVIDPSGLIVTNAHVVEGAESIQVRLSDGRRFAGNLVGRDTRVDLALIKIQNATNLTVLPLGHSFGLEQSVSFGIVSRKGAPLTVAAPGFDFIQTDAAINPGNSGGPLVNMAGEVIGVNSMAARNGSIGFAIPSNLVQQLVPQLATKGRVEWGWLGVSIGEVTEADLERLKLREPRGVLVRDVMPGEPAERGGVRANDVIVEFDGAALEGPRDLQRAVSTTPVGKRVRVTVLRDGRETEVEVTVGLYQERETPRPERPRPPPPPDEPKPDAPRPDAPKEPTE